MRYTRSIARLGGTLAILTAMAGCSKSHVTSSPRLTSAQLAQIVMPAPVGYAADSRSGTNGSVSSKVFDQEWGNGASSKFGFVAGYGHSYIDGSSEEGLLVLVLDFSTPAEASNYVRQSEMKNWQNRAHTEQPLNPIPNATVIDSSQSSDGVFTHEAFLLKGNVAATLVYLTDTGGSSPPQLTAWAAQQFSSL